MIGSILIFIGSCFFLVTAIGMLRLPDFYTRLHAGAKCMTAGGISIMLGAVFAQGVHFHSLKLVLVVAFMGIVNPVTTHAISRAAYLFGVEPCPRGEKVEDYIVFDDDIIGVKSSQEISEE